MRDRETQQIDIALRGEELQAVGRHMLRPLTFAGMLVLQKLGNPLANVGNGEKLSMTDFQAAEAIWVLAAPWDLVRDVTLSCTSEDKTPAERAVLDFAASISPGELAAMLASLRGSAAEVDAVAAEVLPDTRQTEASKN